MAVEHYQGGRSGYPELNGYDHCPEFIDNAVKIIHVVDGKEVQVGTMPGYPKYDPDANRRTILCTENTAKHCKEFRERNAPSF